MNSLNTIKQEALEAIAKAQLVGQIEEVRIAFLGKKGSISLQMQALGKLPPEERKEFGAAVNQVKDEVTKALESRKHMLQAKELEVALAKETVDVTLPVRAQSLGRTHLITQVLNECIRIFSIMGFEVKHGPDIEDDFHNFTALNIAEDHPARQMQDTFYVQAEDAHNKPYVLRTHTSSVQIRTMQQGRPPFKFIAPGRVYRSDYDMTHTPMFHQIEGLYVDKSVHMGHLKGCLYEFLQEFFGVKELPIRFRPSFFPFTEPSAEVDIGCSRENGQVQIGNGSDWLEILGCGMVHPNVLKNVGIDPKEYQGFAFGVGIERLAMLKYGAPDLRSFFDSDIRWLNHYGFESSARRQ